jgi:hypothetical protein
MKIYAYVRWRSINKHLFWWCVGIFILYKWNNTNNAEIEVSDVCQNMFLGEVFQEVKFWRWLMDIRKLKVMVFWQITHNSNIDDDWQSITPLAVDIIYHLDYTFFCIFDRNWNDPRHWPRATRNVVISLISLPRTPHKAEKLLHRTRK